MEIDILFQPTYPKSFKAGIPPLPTHRRRHKVAPAHTITFTLNQSTPTDLMYILSTISAQSMASVPPAPAVMVTRAPQPSYGPDSNRRVSHLCEARQRGGYENAHTYDA